MSFTYYRKFDSPEAGARRSARLRGTAPPDENKTARLTQTAKKRKRTAKSDGSVVTESETKRPRKSPPKKKTPTPKKPTPKKSKATRKEVAAPELKVSEKQQDASRSTEPMEVDTAQQPAAKKRQAEPISVVRYRKRRKIESESGLTAQMFSDRVASALADEKKILDEDEKGELYSKVKAFVDSYMKNHSTFSDNQAASSLPPHPRSAAFAITESNQLLYMEKLINLASELREKNPPNFFSIDLSVSQLFRTSVSGGDNEGDEDAINILAEGSALKPLESAVLLTDELVTRSQQASHFARHINDYFSSVASVLREEELGETVPLTLASASGQ